MELREWAVQILSSDTLEGKLTSPFILTDYFPGTPFKWKEPIRPPGMGFTKRSREEKLPPFNEHKDPDKRAICLHRFAGHELLAVEIMAWVLLAYPEASPKFRKGVAYTLKEEQEHVRLYIKRMEELGIKFGDLPLYRHFWIHTPYIQSPLHYISLMSLTFEGANLDFASLYRDSFKKAGDEKSAALMQTILTDEINHVKFGWKWLKEFKDKETSEWEAWESTLNTTLVTPKRAKGFYVHSQPRLDAGLPVEWIKRLASS